MQLPWQYIDYVIIHELVHTKVLKHGPDFWNAMSEIIPNLTQVRKDMRLYQPILDGSPADAVA
jgi:predicted metal-dependent hydrolase